MTAIEAVLSSGDYAGSRNLNSDGGVLFFRAERDVDADRRFLVRVAARAIFDVCMYKPGNANYESAKGWLLGTVDTEFRFTDLMDIVELDWMLDQVMSAAHDMGAARSKIRDIKRLLYNLTEDASTEQPS
jgi:hypothetical protein